MKTEKKLKIFTVIFVIMSLALYLTVLIQMVSSMEIEYLLVALFLAQGFLVSAIVNVCFLILLKLGKLEEAKVHRKIKVSIAIVLTTFVLLIVVGLFTFHDTSTPEELLKSDTEYVKSIFPYIDLKTEDRENYDIYVSHFPGTDIFNVRSMSKNDDGTHAIYECGYFKSTSLLMNLKMHISNNAYEYFGHTEFEEEQIKVGKYKVTIYYQEYRYQARINGIGKIFSMSLDNAEVDIEEFAETAVKQYILLQTASQSGLFLY